MLNSHCQYALNTRDRKIDKQQTNTKEYNTVTRTDVISIRNYNAMVLLYVNLECACGMLSLVFHELKYILFMLK